MANAVIVQPAAVSISAQGTQKLAVSVLSETGHILQTSGVRWEVADPSIAWVEHGVVKAVSVGITDITAVHGDVRSLPVPVSVNPIVGLSASPALGRLPVGARVELKAIGIVDDGSLEDLSASGSVSWSSSNAEVLQIEDDGTLLAFKPGRAVVTATWRNMKTQAMAVEVADIDIDGLTIDPDRASMRVSETLPLAVVAVFGDGVVADATPHVTWTTTRPEIADLDQGILRGLEPGVAEVFASWMGLRSDPMRVTVAVADAVGVILGNTSPVMLQDTRIPLRSTAITADGKLLDASQQTTWYVDDESVVRVDANGFLIARSEGSTMVEAEVGGHRSPPVEVEVRFAELVRLTVEPGAVAAHAGDVVELTVYAELNDGDVLDVTPQIQWEIEGEGVSSDRYNVLGLEHGARARVRARLGEVVSPWAQLVAAD